MAKAKEHQKLGEWEVGQEVVVRARGMMAKDHIALIERITEGRGGTVYVQGQGYDQNGWQRGGDAWGRLHIHSVTQEDRIKIAGEKAKLRLQYFKWNDIDDKKAVEIRTILKEKYKLEI